MAEPERLWRDPKNWSTKVVVAAVAIPATVIATLAFCKRMARIG